MVTGRQERYGIRWSSFSLARMFLSNLRELGRVMAQIEPSDWMLYSFRIFICWQGEKNIPPEISQISQSKKSQS